MFFITLLTFLKYTFFLFGGLLIGSYLWVEIEEEFLDD